MALTKQVTLITGGMSHSRINLRIALTTSAGNSGIGYALAALLIEDKSKHVIIGSRSVERGEAALKELQSLDLPGSAEMLQLDVTSTDSIVAATKSVEANYGR